MPVPHWLPGRPVAPVCPRLPFAITPIETRLSATGHRCDPWIEPDWVLPGNGAAELFTWAARDAAAAGVSGLLAPGFADYRRALQCWDAASVETPLALSWDHAGPLHHPPLEGAVAWICNPHNPTGQLWSRASLKPCSIAMPW